MDRVITVGGELLTFPNTAVFAFAFVLGGN